MTHKVSYGSMGWLTTILVGVLLIATTAWIFTLGVSGVSYFMVALVAATFLSALFYAPVSIEVTDSELIINRVLARKRIPMSNIRSARLHTPRSVVRTCGGSGFFGNWGHFAEKGVGSYFGYFGKTTDCFLVKLTSGRRYLLGCNDPAEIVEAINHNCGSDVISE